MLLFYNLIIIWRINYINTQKVNIFKSGMFLDSNYTNKEIYCAMKKVNEAGLTTPNQQTDYLIKAGYGSVIDKFSFYDGEIKVYIYNENMDVNRFKDMIVNNEYFKYSSIVTPTLWQNIQAYFYKDDTNSEWAPISNHVVIDCD